jgi:urease accessory protein
MKPSSARMLAALLLAGAAGTAAAHTGHDGTGLQAGLLHPFALDHLLAMVAVGAWSVAALPGRRAWLGPAAFLAAMAAGAALAIGSLPLPGVEAGVSASLLLVGGMLAFPSRVPAGPGLAAVALAALLHGLAHGAELPAGAGAPAYAAGFLATTALLHGGGVGLGLWLRRAGPRAWRALGALLGTAGLLMLTRL